MKRLLCLAACLAALVVVVLSDDGPRANGSAAIEASGSVRDEEVRTRSVRAEELELEGGHRRAQVERAEDRREDVVAIEFEEPSDPAGIVLEGTVLTAEGVAPCAGAQVVLWGHGDGLPEELQRTSSDAEGAFRFAEVPAGMFTLVAAKVGEGRAVRDVLAEGPRTGGPFVLVLSGTRGELVRFVQHANTGEALAGVTVHDNTGYRTRTDEAGRFTLPRPADGAAAGVRLELDGFLSRALLLDLAAVDPVIVLHPTQHAAVRIIGLSENSPPKGLFLQPRDGMVDRRVEAEVTRLAGGAFLLSAPGLAPARRTYCEISASEQATMLTRAYAWEPADRAIDGSARSLPAVRLQPGRSVRLSIVDASSGTALVGAHVLPCRPHLFDPFAPTEPEPCDEPQHERDATAGLRGTVLSVPGGFTELSGLAVGTTCVGVALAGYHTQHVVLQRGEYSARVALAPKTPTVSRIFGEVLDSDERPLAGAVVTALDARGARFGAVSGESGEFEIGGLYDADYQLNVSYSREGQTSGVTLSGVYRPSAVPFSLSVEVP